MLASSKLPTASNSKVTCLCEAVCRVEHVCLFCVKLRARSKTYLCEAVCMSKTYLCEAVCMSKTCLCDCEAVCKNRDKRRN